MSVRASRAYKLKLSAKGVTLFIGCHSRLCSLAGDLLPYGTTLRVAVALLQELPSDELAAAVMCDELVPLSGKQTHFVGTTPALAVSAASLAERVATSAAVAATPQTGTIYLAALAHMSLADDRQIKSAYQTVMACEQMRAPNCG